MAQDESELPAPEPESGPEEQPAGPRHRNWRVALAVVVGAILIAGLIGWLNREQIAHRLISGQLEELGLPSRYEIESIGPQAQILRNVVIGDPERPDLTIERVEAGLVAGRVTLVRPRLYGSYRGGKLSFGSLDPVIFAESEEPFRMPELDLAIVDGRGLLESDFGPVGFKAEGKGPLRDGFSGILAATAPRLEASGCVADAASFYGKVTVSGEKPHIAGPLRLGALTCPKQGLRLAKSVLGVGVTLDRALDGAEGRLALTAGELKLNGSRITSGEGTSRFTFRKQALTARYELTGKRLASPQLAAASLGIDGVVRGADNFARIELEGDVSGNGFRLGQGVDGAMADAGRAGEGTLAAPVIAQIRKALRREQRGSRLSANFILRRTHDTTSLVLPQAVLRGGSGKALLSFSRVQMSATGASVPHIAGNFSTGGDGLPRIAGRMEHNPAGGLTLHVRMPEYRAGSARLAVPDMMLVQSESGSLGFAGKALLSGALPGGEAEGLSLPLEGNWSPQNGLSVWRKCLEVRFEKLRLASLAMERRKVPLCPPRGGAILRSDARGTRIAAGAPLLELAGTLGETPIHIASGPLGLAYPGTLSAQSLEVTLGPADAASHFRIARLDASTASEISGSFENAEVSLSAVPLDLTETAGNWRFANGELTIGDALLKLADRQSDARFQPLAATGATLRLAENVITAEAVLRSPNSSREVVRTQIRHDLATGRGNADLFVDGIVFDDALQPDELSHLALGIIANAEGTVRGRGRIDWSEEEVTSDGRFTTDALDFAAAFGPVKGLSGTVVFTDLLGLVTAPDQRLHIAANNPGIEVNDGVLSFELRPDSVLAVNGARWPFLGGELRLEPTQMTIGVTQDYRYTLTIDGLDAARLLEKMELGNISANGTFDGVLPLVFDKDGGHVVGGVLKSRPPGGNLSYVGKLTYEDLSAMANFAFDALKSLDYRTMRIGMDGSLEGEIITRVSFDGIRQGALAKRNFLTRQIAKLPIHFDVNLKAPFFQLVTSLRSMYEPAYIRDPRSLGLIDSAGRPITQQPAVPDRDESIQPPASEDVQ